jgi:hypothetical protein
MIALTIMVIQISTFKILPEKTIGDGLLQVEFQSLGQVWQGARYSLLHLPLNDSLVLYCFLRS